MGWKLAREERFAVASHSSEHFDGRCAQQDVIITPCHGQKYLYYSTEGYRRFFFTEEDLVLLFVDI